MTSEEYLKSVENVIYGETKIMEEQAKYYNDIILCELSKPKSALDTQVGGDHYKTMKIQPITFIMENNLSFAVGNIIKYVCRYDKKNGLEDIQKARQYLDFLEEKYNKDNNIDLK